MASRSGGASDGVESGEELADPGSQLIVDITARLDEEKSRILELPSNDPFLPELHQVGNSLSEIANQMSLKEKITFYPKNIVRNPSPMIKRLCTRVEEKCGQDERSLAYLANSLSVTLNIPCKDRVPHQIICDVCILSLSTPVFVLTVVKDNDDSLSVSDYNLNITKGLVSEVRNFTDEHFSALYGVLQEKDLKSPESFEKAVELIESNASSLCIPDSLSMTDTKFKNVIKALTASLAVSRAVKVVKSSSDGTDLANFQDEKDEDLWFLTKEQFHLLTENIDTSGLVVVWAGPHTGSTTLMVEVASRLEKSGRTMLVSGSETVCQSARNQRVCSQVISRDEFVKLQSDIGYMLADVDHVVAEDVPEALLQTGDQQKHVWLCLKTEASLSPKDRSPPMRSPIYMSMDGRTQKTNIVSIKDRTPHCVETLSFRIEGEASDPWVYDFVVVTVRGIKVIIAADHHHHKLKSFFKLDGEHRTDYLSIDKDAAGITNLDNMVAITVPSSRLIRVIDVTPNLQPRCVIRTERRYHDITSLGVDKIAACSPKDGSPCVDIIDYSGKIYKSITSDESGQSLFSHPLTIQSVSSNSVVVYDKQNRSIVCVSDRGHVLFKYCPEKKLENPCGMTVTPAGDILVADSRQQRIILLSQNGQFVKYILTRRDNLIYPYRVWFDDSGLLYVALFYKEVKIFEFT